VVTVLHDLTLAARYCERVIMLSGGRVAADGAPGDVLSTECLASVFALEARIAHDDAGLTVLPWASMRARAKNSRA
jgi:iron complex transport system ATP-binding protein